MSDTTTPLYKVFVAVDGNPSNDVCVLATHDRDEAAAKFVEKVNESHVVRVIEA